MLSKLPQFQNGCMQGLTNLLRKMVKIIAMQKTNTIVHNKNAVLTFHQNSAI